MEKKKLVLFDFDGTITTRDTYPLFFKHTFGHLKYYSGFLLFSPMYLLYLTKLVSGGRFKELILSFYLKGRSEADMKELGQSYLAFLERNNIFKKEFLQKIEDYRSSGAGVAVVSASPDLWLKPFCDKMQINCISTRLLYADGKFTGKLDGNNCNGEEKRRRVEEKYVLKEYDEIIVYGDSNGDKQMMQLASEKHWV